MSNAADIPEVRRRITSILSECSAYSEPEDYWDRVSRVALAIMEGLGSLYQDYPGIRLGEQESDEHIRLTFDQAGYIYTYTIDVNEYSFKEKVTPPYYARR